jgi:predicted nucleic acid-binding protein
VKNGVFVDTAWPVALLDMRDSHHEAAKLLARTFDDDSTPMVTTDAVMVEIANFFSDSPVRKRAIDWIGWARSSPGWDVVVVDRELQLRAEARYRHHQDKNWSMTDCIAMEVMQDRRLTDVATSDGGFEQAGFHALLLPPHRGGGKPRKRAR